MNALWHKQYFNFTFTPMISVTESNSAHEELHLKSVRELLIGINQEDQTVPLAVERAIPAISTLVERVVTALKSGGRLFYIGAGTSGRLGILDASECPPTFGVPADMVVGIIAGGDKAIRTPVEFAEDDREKGWMDLCEFKVSKDDIVIGIAASGRTPYVIGALDSCRKNGISTGCITCNPGSEILKHSDFPVVVNVGPEYVTGSTRMKSGTAQKLVLNMITTAAMICIGRVVGNRMVDMQLSNHKLVDRGTRMIMDSTGLNEEVAGKLLLQYGSVRSAIDHFNKSQSASH